MVAAAASTLQFSSDALLVALVVGNGVVGWRTGTLRRLLALGGVYASVVAAYYTGNGFASLVHKGDILANAWSFVVIALVMIIIFELIGHAISDRLEHVATVAFDRIIGMVIGAVVGFFQASILFLVALAIAAAPSSPDNTIPPSRDDAANAVRSAPLSSQAIRAQPVVRAIFGPVFSTDLTVHLEDGTQLTTP